MFIRTWLYQSVLYFLNSAQPLKGGSEVYTTRFLTLTGVPRITSPIISLSHRFESCLSSSFFTELELLRSVALFSLKLKIPCISRLLAL